MTRQLKISEYIRGGTVVRLDLIRAVKGAYEALAAAERELARCKADYPDAVVLDMASSAAAKRHAAQRGCS
ncbi:MAG: hypothetical protein ACR2FU_25270 [Streptosporangiaceae bacterium]